MPLKVLPEMTHLSMSVAAPALLKSLPFGTEVPMPRAFGRAEEPVGSVPMKRSCNSVV
jgi:hypothetical protein